MPLIQEIEPMMPSERAIERSDLRALAEELEHKAETLEGLMPAPSGHEITENNRLINAYYSNLIEGHEVPPEEVAKAMLGQFSQNPEQACLQKEALAHMRTQAWIDQNLPDKTRLVSKEFIKAIHCQFYRDLPASLKMVSDGDNKKPAEVVPGHFRKSGQNVVIGWHRPPESERLDEFMARFSEAYDFDRNRGYRRLIAAMSSHHRLMWIHPFLDGNGRVCRLFTDTYLKQSGIGAVGIWCLSRGLAMDGAAYKQALAQADSSRQGDSDGRGGRSEKGLVAFCRFMLKTAIKEVDEVSRIVHLGGLDLYHFDELATSQRR